MFNLCWVHVQLAYDEAQYANMWVGKNCISRQICNRIKNCSCLKSLTCEHIMLKLKVKTSCGPISPDGDHDIINAKGSVGDLRHPLLSVVSHSFVLCWL
jgi:hypothetical protein